MKKLLFFNLSIIVLAIAVVGILFTDTKTVGAQGSTPVDAGFTCTANCPGGSDYFFSFTWWGMTSTPGPANDYWYLLKASVSTKVLLLTPTALNPNIKIGSSGFDCSKGGTFKMPISADGEVFGNMTEWYGSPAVEYLNDNLTDGKKWLGHTEGLTCSDLGTACTYAPLEGVWSDTWSSSDSGVSCTTLNANMGECVIPANNPESIEVTLVRKVKNISWKNTQVAPYEPTMKSTATINCVAPTAALEVIEPTYPTPASPSTGDSVGFYATIKNKGNIASVAFTPILFIDVDADGTWDQSVPATQHHLSLAVGAEDYNIWTNAWTAVFGVNGVHRYKICPDSSGQGCLTKNMTVEQGTTITPPPATDPPVILPPATQDTPIASLGVYVGDGVLADSATVNKGNSVTLDWSSTYADSCTAPSTNPTDWASQQPNDKNSRGTKIVYPASGINTYTLFCSKNGVDSKLESVEVNATDSTSGTNVRDL
ncbi:MAG: hypothetical protein Q7S57_04730 [bacterium]|nr:hypothetical protein [bacterium]